MKNVKLAHFGFPRHSVLLSRLQARCAGREGPCKKNKDCPCPSANQQQTSQKEGRKQKNLCEEDGGKGEDGDSVNKVLLLSYSLRLCVKDQKPLISEKLFRIPFYP